MNDDVLTATEAANIIVERAIERSLCKGDYKGPKRIAVLYGCPKKLTNAHKPVAYHQARIRWNISPPAYFVRMKIINWKARKRHLEGEFGLVDALSHADPPMDGETLLNTVYVD